MSAARKRRVYIDTSAYLSLLLDEAHADQVAASTDGAVCLSSVLLVLETRRNLIRFARQGALDAGQYETCIARVAADMEAFELRDFTLDLCMSVAMPAVATPRSLDLAHLQTALWFHAVAPLDQFLTMDAVQAQAARELGLRA
ncbi:MAG: hypothetical protein ABI689_08095 [Thermoanaerobaculia bacterium]